jgi:hypothetical protein
MVESTYDGDTEQVHITPRILRLLARIAPFSQWGSPFFAHPLVGETDKRWAVSTSRRLRPLEPVVGEASQVEPIKGLL